LRSAGQRPVFTGTEPPWAGFWVVRRDPGLGLGFEEEAMLQAMPMVCASAQEQ